MPTDQLTSTTRMFRSHVVDAMPGALPQRVLLASTPLLLGISAWGLAEGYYVVTSTMLVVGGLFALSPRLVAASGTAITGHVLATVLVTAVILPVAVGGASYALLLLVSMLPFIVYAWLGPREAVQWSLGPAIAMLLLGVKASLRAQPEAAGWAWFAVGALLTTTGFAFAFRDAMTVVSRGQDPRNQSLEREYHAVLEALEMALGTSAKKDRFLALMSFELRTPLTAIMGYSELLGEILEDIGDERDVRETRAIQASSERLLHVVDDILDLSQITEGTLELRSSPVDLAAIVRHALQEVRKSHRGVRVSAEIAHTGLVMGDAGRLGRLVTNLAGLSLKGARPGDDVRVLLTSRVRAASLVFEGPPDQFEIEDLRRLKDGLELPVDDRPLQLGLELTMADALLRAFGGELSLERGPRAQVRLIATMPVDPAFENSAG